MTIEYVHTVDGRSIPVLVRSEMKRRTLELTYRYGQLTDADGYPYSQCDIDRYIMYGFDVVIREC